jgi:membrane associated rhomboid family serine protease
MPEVPPRISYGSYAFGRPWTPAVRALIIGNVLVFLLQAILPQTAFTELLGLQLPEVFSRLRLWQPFTYLFLHGGFLHLAFNLFTLWMFGCEVEAVMGTAAFLGYYLLTGIGAGWCVAGVGWLAQEHSLTIGSSGAIFGVLMAYGILFAELSLTLLVFFVLPVRMRAKTMVLLFGILEFVAGVGNVLGQVSHLAHLSGLALGYAYFLVVRPEWARRFTFWQDIKLWWRKHRLKKTSPQRDPELYVDQILEKISHRGIGSLSVHEREILAAAARRRQEPPSGSRNG